MTDLIDAVLKAATKAYRRRIAARVFAQSSGKVRRGPFSGMIIGGDTHLSSTYRALTAYGLYEPEVLALLSETAPVRTLVNIGAGDGYYSIGLLRSGLALRSICFELDEKGRRAVFRNAAINGVGERIVVHGAAGPDLVDILRRDGVNEESAIVLCDIEGGEFSVISPSVIALLPRALFVIELHPFAVASGEAAVGDLEARFAATHDVREIKAGPGDWSSIAVIEALTDLERALVTTEGRKQLGRWMIATPRAAA